MDTVPATLDDTGPPTGAPVSGLSDWQPPTSQGWVRIAVAVAAVVACAGLVLGALARWH